MNYTIKYPNTYVFTEPEEGLIKNNIDFYCEVCGIPTLWVDTELELYLCSEECRVVGRGALTLNARWRSRWL